MSARLITPGAAGLGLHGDTAANLMTPDPVSVRRDATCREAAAFLSGRGVTGAPVVDEAGRVIGVVTQTDLLIHEREAAARAGHRPDYFRSADGPAVSVPEAAGSPEVGGADCSVAEVMTPGVFSVTPETPAARVVADMLGLRIHRIFVADEDGTLVGVISLFDILRRLRP